MLPASKDQPVKPEFIFRVRQTNGRPSEPSESRKAAGGSTKSVADTSSIEEIKALRAERDSTKIEV